MVFGKISSVLEESGFSHHGFASSIAPLTMEYYRRCLERGDHADIGVFARPRRVQSQSARVAPKARTAIVVAPVLFTSPLPPRDRLKAPRIAQYARGSDYHHRF